MIMNKIKQWKGNPVNNSDIGYDFDYETPEENTEQELDMDTQWDYYSGLPNPKYYEKKD
jgi:hypothetical protein